MSNGRRASLRDGSTLSSARGALHPGRDHRPDCCRDAHRRVSPAWWITGLVAVGFALIVGLSISVSVDRRLALAPYIPAIVIGLVAAGLLIAGASPAWWITGLVAVGFAMVKFMSSH
jgi:hypothetical protein